MNALQSVSISSYLSLADLRVAADSVVANNAKRRSTAPTRRVARRVGWFSTPKLLVTHGFAQAAPSKSRRRRSLVTDTADAPASVERDPGVDFSPYHYPGSEQRPAIFAYV